ncbi:MAG TPA: hypothetical protein VFJ22_20150 [Dermatophilaceae bacterium]|jgi:hypothetical protein|nr:hypothetical protein [Dermatophilaceae bacterium]
MQKKSTLITVAAGLAAAVGLAVTGASLANAQTSTPTASTGYGSAQPGQGQPPSGRAGGAFNGNTDPTKAMRSDEKLLTGDTAAKVTAAAKAKEPNATIQRVETDSDGVYEAHMVRSDGTLITVQIDKNFAVTNVIVGGPGGPGGHGGPQQNGSTNGSTSGTPSTTN